MWCAIIVGGLSQQKSGDFELLIQPSLTFFQGISTLQWPEPPTLLPKGTHESFPLFQNFSSFFHQYAYAFKALLMET